jgi:hemerythrin superfamily protein
MATARKSSRKTASKRTAKTEARTRARPPSMSGEHDAIELLTEDHRKVDELFEEYEASKDEADDADKENRVAEICAELTIHASVEEEIFYPAAREALDEDEDTETLDEAEVEHQSIKDLVEQLQAMTPGEELYDAKVKVLAEYVKHHVQEEEGELFPALRGSDLDLSSLGAEIAQRKEELRTELGAESAG